MSPLCLVCEELRPGRRRPPLAPSRRSRPVLPPAVTPNSLLFFSDLSFSSYWSAPLSFPVFPFHSSLSPLLPLPGSGPRLPLCRQSPRPLLHCVRLHTPVPCLKPEDFRELDFNNPSRALFRETKERFGQFRPRRSVSEVESREGKMMSGLWF